MNLLFPLYTLLLCHLPNLEIWERYLEGEKWLGMPIMYIFLLLDGCYNSNVTAHKLSELF